MKNQSISPKAVFVGQGLEKRTREDCLEERLNPNDNAAGAIRLPADRSAMKAFIEQARKDVFAVLK